MMLSTLALAFSLLSGRLTAARAFPFQETRAAAKPDLASIKAQVDAYYSQQYNVAKAAGAVNRTDLSAKVAVFAAALLKGIDVAKLPADEASQWAQIYEEADQSVAAQSLEKKAIDYTSVQLMFCTGDLIPKLLNQGKDEQVIYLLKHSPDYEARQIGMIGEIFYSNCLRLGYDKSKPGYIERGIKILENKIDFGPNELNPSSHTMADNVSVGFEMNLLEMKYKTKPSPAILHEIRALRLKYAASKSQDAFGNFPSHRVDEFLNRISAIGKAAPALEFQKSIGDFKGLGSLKGKVVLLDFMAHWCGPCKAALPGIRKLQLDFGASGFQVVSVSSFYGYFGSKADVPPAQEFALMHDFVKQYQMSWPVIFDAKQATQAKYGVSAIPYMVLIDRKGVVRQVEVGHTEEGEAAMRTQIQSLLAERS